MGRIRIKLKQLSYLVALCLGISFFNPCSAEASENLLIVYTVNYPLKYFAERIGGEHARVVLPVPYDADPAYWIPDRETVFDYQKADLILLNGANYARWTEAVTLSPSRMVDTSRKFRELYVRTNETVTHSHGPGGSHAHKDMAFTTWMDFNQAAQQAEMIMTALSRKRPSLGYTFEENYSSLKSDLMALDREMKKVASKIKYQPLVASHPVYQYFGRQYGLNIKSVHWEPHEVPEGKQVMDLQKILKNHHAGWMIWEDEPARKSVEILHSMGMRSLVFNPCGNVPEQGDFLTVMRENIARMKSVY